VTVSGGYDLAVASPRPLSGEPTPRRTVAAGRALKVAFLVSRLDRGGTERQLIVLARGLRERGHSVVVLVFYPGGALEGELHNAGVRVRVLHKRGRWDLARFLLDLRRVVREERPDVLHGYLDVPNTLALAARGTVDGLKVVWGLRASKIDRRCFGPLERRTTALVSFALRALARFPDLLIANSRTGAEHATSMGVPRGRTVVIPNGIDTERLSPDRESGRRLRRQWGVADDERLIGLVARLDPLKDHRTFLEAAARLAGERGDVRFVCVGDGEPALGRAMQELARGLGLGDRLHWAGVQFDMRAVYNALDIACSSSISEGFPNVVGEAMACGVPCVVTDVGDSAWLLGQPAFSVAARDPVAMADRIRAILDSDPASVERLRAEMRGRVAASFSVATLIDRTEQVMAELIGAGSR
jgi:glycosyltransferase involved in cell wall biosynthesis